MTAVSVTTAVIYLINQLRIDLGQKSMKPKQFHGLRKSLGGGRSVAMKIAFSVCFCLREMSYRLTQYNCTYNFITVH